jgi:hypothetical protein
MTVDLSTREDLVKTLHLAAEIEHNLLCQYLFAAYSMKTSTAEGLDAVQLETARGWESQVTLVARQEMEHMGLALNMLAAIGATPRITRPNFPQAVSRYGRLGIASVLTRFSPETIGRFQDFESPHPVPPDFCSLPGLTRAEIKAKLLDAPPPRAHGFADAEIPFTSVQDLYESLALGFTKVAATIGEKELFSGSVANEVWGGPGSPYYGGMDDLDQYGLDIIAVTDLASAHEAIAIIVEQGEGILAPPEYRPHVHFCIFSDVLDALRRAGFDPARPVVDNPLVSMHPDITAPDEVNLLTVPSTREVAEAFNDSYELMLMLMLWLYGEPGKTPAQTNALMDAIFFPLMTMFVRPLAEVLTTLPAFTDRPGNAGPGFELSQEVVTLPIAWEKFQARLDALTVRLDTLALYRERPPGDPTVERLRYIAVNMRRLAEDWRDNWQDIGGPA